MTPAKSAGPAFVSMVRAMRIKGVCNMTTSKEQRTAIEAAKEARHRAAADNEPRPMRGRPRKALQVRYRKSRAKAGGPRMAYSACAGTKPRTLSVTEDRPDLVKDAFALRTDVLEAHRAGYLPSWRIPLGVVIEAEKKLVAPKKNADVTAVHAAKSRIMKLDRIADFFGRDLPMREVTPAKCREYEKTMLALPARPNTSSTDTYKSGTIRVDLMWLRCAINRYAAENNRKFETNLHIPKRPKGRKNWLDRPDVAVLICSAMYGWQWDRDAVRVVERTTKDVDGNVLERWEERRPGDWVTKVVVDPVTGEERRRRVVHSSYSRAHVRTRGRALARAIVTGFYTGTRVDRLRNLGWEPDDYCGWLDLDRGLIVRSGMLNGDTSKSDGEPKSADPAYMPRPFLNLARGWWRNDERAGVEFVVHQPDGSRYEGKGSITNALKRVGRRCGYPDVIFHELRHSTVTVCLLNGCSIGETAAFVDMSVEMVEQVYSHIAEQGTRAGAEAMGRRGRDKRSPSRNRSTKKPRSQMTPQEAMAHRGKRLGLIRK